MRRNQIVDRSIVDKPGAWPPKSVYDWTILVAIAAFVLALIAVQIIMWDWPR